MQGLAGKAVVMIGKQASRLPGMKSLSVQSAPKGQQQRQSDEFKDTEEKLARPSGSSDASGYYDAPEAPQRWVAEQVLARPPGSSDALGKSLEPQRWVAEQVLVRPPGSVMPWVSH